MSHHPAADLSAYAAGTLPTPRAATIAAHLAECGRCRADVASWSSLAAGVRTASEAVAPPAPQLLATVLRRVSGTVAPAYVVPRYVPEPADRRHAALAPARLAAGLLAAQTRLIGWRVWVVAVLAIGAGSVLAGLAPDGRAGDLLGLVIPLVGALAVAAACGVDSDADELVRAAPTSTRVVLLARMTLVLSGTVAAGLVASVALAVPRGDLDLATLVLAWFGPLVPLSAASFALAVLWRPAAGTGIALACWVLRLLSQSLVLNRSVGRVVEAVWQPNVALVLIALAVAAATIVLAPAAARRRIRLSLS